MGEIVNLRRVRKAKVRDEQATLAAENRAKSGLTKLERQAVAQRKAFADRALDGAHLEDQPEKAPD